MGVLRSGARGNMPATAKRLASWRVLKEMLQSFLRRCSLLDVLESLTVGTCVQHFFQVLSRGGGPLAQSFASPVPQIILTVQLFDFRVQFLLTSARSQAEVICKDSKMDCIFTPGVNARTYACCGRVSPKRVG